MLATIILMVTFASALGHVECNRLYPVWQVCMIRDGDGDPRFHDATPSTPAPSPPSDGGNGDDGKGRGHGHGHGEGHGQGKGNNK